MAISGISPNLYNYMAGFKSSNQEKIPVVDGQKVQGMDFKDPKSEKFINKVEDMRDKFNEINDEYIDRYIDMFQRKDQEFYDLSKKHSQEQRNLFDKHSNELKDYFEDFYQERKKSPLEWDDPIWSHKRKEGLDKLEEKQAIEYAKWDNKQDQDMKDYYAKYHQEAEQIKVDREEKREKANEIYTNECINLYNEYIKDKEKNQSKHVMDGYNNALTNSILRNYYTES